MRDPRFHSAYAQRVPIAVEMIVAQNAMMRLFQVPSTICGSRKMARYQSREKCSQTVKRDELKLKAASVSRGRCRNAKNAMAYTPSQRLIRAGRFPAGERPTKR